jgi:hypothetical protein
LEGKFLWSIWRKRWVKHSFKPCTLSEAVLLMDGRLSSKGSTLSRRLQIPCL